MCLYRALLTTWNGSLTAYLHKRCDICGEKIAADEWNEDNDRPCHRLCQNTETKVWEAPLSVMDMQLVWIALRRGDAPRNGQQLVDALFETIKNDRKTYSDERADWQCARRRRSYAQRLLLAMHRFQHGERPTGAFRRL